VLQTFVVINESVLALMASVYRASAHHELARDAYQGALDAVQVLGTKEHPDPRVLQISRALFLAKACAAPLDQDAAAKLSVRGGGFLLGFLYIFIFPV
jgi:hypothetical protein